VVHCQNDEHQEKMEKKKITIKPTPVQFHPPRIYDEITAIEREAPRQNDSV
jgi:hypothetical protein